MITCTGVDNHLFYMSPWEHFEFVFSFYQCLIITLWHILVSPMMLFQSLLLTAAGGGQDHLQLCLNHLSC